MPGYDPTISPRNPPHPQSIKLKDFTVCKSCIFHAIPDTFISAKNLSRMLTARTKVSVANPKKFVRLQRSSTFVFLSLGHRVFSFCSKGNGISLQKVVRLKDLSRWFIWLEMEGMASVQSCEGEVAKNHPS